MSALRVNGPRLGRSRSSRIEIMGIIAAWLLAGCSGGSDAGPSLQSGGSQPNTAAPASSSGAKSSASAAAEALPDWSGSWSLTEASRDTAVMGNGFMQDLTPKYLAMLPRPQAPTSSSAASRRKTKGWKNNLTQCIPAGFPGDLMHPYAHEYLFSPGRVTMLIEDGEVRRIHTDGRGHLPSDELYASLVGDSVGHWEGDTLVVDTIGMRPEAELTLAGLHVTKNTHVLERIRKKDMNTLQVDAEIQDPEIFKQPFHYTLYFARVPGELLENDCALDQRDNDQSLDLTPPPQS